MPKVVPKNLKIKKLFYIIIHFYTYQNNMDQILQSLVKVKSIWELMRNIPIEFEKAEWVMILNNLIPLFRKDTFFNIVGNKRYYPQPTPNCRYYVKPNDGSCGKGIQIINKLPLVPIKDHTVCPEIMSPLVSIGPHKYKYDYRVWIGIQSDLKYYICPTFICRTSMVPFNLDTINGSLTNTSLYSEQHDYQNVDIYNKANCIVHDILKYLEPKECTKTSIMLTGWDFIESKDGDLFVLEVNCNPGIGILHTQTITEFLLWIESLK